MKWLHFFLLFIMFGCSQTGTKVEPPKDIFDTVFLIKKDPSLTHVEKIFGKPNSIEVTRGNANIDEYSYLRNDQHPMISVFVNRDTKKATGFGIMLSLEVDTYEYLKERFKGYRWIEKPLPSKAVDVVEELYLVEIPELGIGFQYDNQDPLRRPLWIYVE